MSASSRSCLAASPWFLLTGALVLLSGCVTPRYALEEAEDVPDHFLVGTLAGAGTTEPIPGQGCRNPMVDPRDGTRLQLVRSAEGQGDYQVPVGRYGVGEEELLRLDCGTGQVIGIIHR